ncbi:MAG: CrcB family protein [Actinobacteria bacterium]|nr:CrcB family protein [Actinomycetota bacterium]
MALGSVFGSLLRWILTTTNDQNRLGTLIANLLGIALASFFLVFTERHASEAIRHFLLPGFCGGLTTFSAVMAITLHEASGTLSIPAVSGARYLLVTVVLSLCTVAICIPSARRLIPVKK